MRHKSLYGLIVCFSVMVIFCVYGNISTMISNIPESDSLSSSSSSTSSRSTTTHYCDADGCMREGIKSYPGISGETEWYCQEHYDEIMDIIGMMEKDVGTGTASKHTCEVCSKEGTHSMVGFSGETEYYCTEHYNEMNEMLNTLLGY